MKPEKIDLILQSSKYPNLIEGYRVLTLNQLLSSEIDEADWIVEQLIPAKGVTVLSAEAGKFKTWILLALAISISSGDPLFGHFESSKTGVLMIDEENPIRLLRARLEMLGVNEQANIHFMVAEGFILNDQQASRIIRICKSRSLGLVTFDSLVRIHKGNENDAGEMAEVFRYVKKLNKAGLTVIFTHHNRKSQRFSENLSQEMRGSSDILAALDCHLALSRKGQTLTLNQTKNRLNEELPPIELEFHKEDESVQIKYIGSLEPQQSKQTRVRNTILKILMKSANINQKQLLVALKETDEPVNQKTLRIILSKMVVDGDVSMVRGLKNSTIYKLSEK